MRAFSWVLFVTFLVSATGFAAPAQTDLEARRKALNDLLAEQWQYTLRTNPTFASILGDKRWNDKLEDFSQKAIDDDLEQNRRISDAFRGHRHDGISGAGGAEQDADGARPAKHAGRGAV